MGKKHKRKKKLYMAIKDGQVYRIDTIEAMGRDFEFGDIHDTFGETLQEQDERADRLRRGGMDVEDIADAMGVSEYRAQQMLTRFDSGRWDE